MNSSKIVAALLSLASLSLAACSGGASTTSSSSSAAATSASSLSDFCGSLSERLNACDSTSSVQTVTNKCENDFAAIYPKLRADWVSSVEACMPQQDCASVLKDTAFGDCFEEASASLAPTSAGSAFCDAYADADLACDKKLDKASCLSAAKQYNDATLREAQACTSQSCSGMKPCIDAALGDSK